MESARETARRRAEGDLQDAAERLEEERERFKSQVGAAHAEILRLGAEAAELEKKVRRNKDREEERRRNPSGGAHAGGGRTAERSRASGGGVVDGENIGVGGTAAVVWGDDDAGEGTGTATAAATAAAATAGRARKRPAERGAADDGEDDARQREWERALRREVEGEREALRRMCNGLAVDLREAVEGRAEAEDEREALVQVGVGAGVGLGLSSGVGFGGWCFLLWIGCGETCSLGRCVCCCFTASSDGVVRVERL